MRRYLLAGALFLSVFSYGAKSNVQIDGVMESAKGPAAVIGGRLCHIDDKIDGGVITAINLEGVTISRKGKETVYKVESRGSTKAGAPKPKKESAFSSWFKRFEKKKKKQAVSPPKKSSTQKTSCRPSGCGGTIDSSLKDKMNRAELLYKKEISEFNQFRSRTLNSCKSGSDLTKAAEKYNTMVRVNLSKIRHLELPQSGPAEYNAWVGSYLQKLEAMRAGNLKEIDAAVHRAGYTSGRMDLHGTDLIRGKK